MLQTLEDYNITPDHSPKRVIVESDDEATGMSGMLNGLQTQVRKHFLVTLHFPVKP